MSKRGKDKPTLKRARSGARDVPAFEPTTMDGPKRLRHSGDVALQSIAGRLREQLIRGSHFGVSIAKTFKAFDSNDDGHLSPDEFLSALHHLGYHPTAAEVQGLAALFDADDDGSISVLEFLRFVHGTASGAGSPGVHWGDASAAGTSLHGGAGSGAGSGAGAGSPSGPAPPLALSSPGSADDYVSSPALSALTSKVPRDELSYQHAKIALACAAELGRSGRLSPSKKGALKDLIVRGDERIAAAAMVFDEDGDDADLLDTLCRIAELGV